MVFPHCDTWDTPCRPYYLLKACIWTNREAALKASAKVSFSYIFAPKVSSLLKRRFSYTEATHLSLGKINTEGELQQYITSCQIYKVLPPTTIPLNFYIIVDDNLIEIFNLNFVSLS